MTGPIVYLTSICPQCKGESVLPYTRLEIAELLLSSRPFVLYSACHSISWEATEEDRRQMFALIKPRDESAHAPSTATQFAEPKDVVTHG